MVDLPLIDIRPDHWKIITNILQEVVPDHEIWAFGSRAKWSAKSYSDLDLALVGDEALSFETLAFLSEAFADSDLPYKVDIVDWASTSETFRQIIHQERVLIYPHWVQLSGISSFLSGGTPSKTQPKFWGGAIPWLTPKDMSEFRGDTAECVTEEALGNGTRLASSDAVYVAVRGMSLHNEIRIVKPRKSMAFNQDIKAIVADGVDSDYIYYAILAQKPYMLSSVESSGHGTGVLPTRVLSNLKVLNFSARRQRSIAAFFMALDSKIELNQRMNRTLEAMVQAIFHDWFVDFGPTKAKAEGRAPYLAPETWALFPAYLDKDGKPNGWTGSTIGQEVKVVGGSTPSTKNEAFWNGDVHWATPKDLSSLTAPVLLSTERTITSEGLQQISSGLLPQGTVLLSSRAPIGYLAISQVPVAVNQGFIAMVCDRTLSNVFAWQWARANMDLIHAKANGSTFMEISKGSFKTIPVILPDSDLLRVFELSTKPMLERLIANEQEIHALEHLRDELLPKVMSGEIHIPDSEKVFEAKV